MRRLATIGMLSGALIAGGIAAAPASLAAVAMPPTMTFVGVVPGAVGTSYTYSLSAPPPAGLAPGLTIRINGAAITGATGDNTVSQTLNYGYVDRNTVCEGAGIIRESASATAPIAKSYTLPASINGVTPTTGGYFCVQRVATGTGNANQGNLYRSNPYFLPLGVASNVVVNPPLIIPPGGRDIIYPDEAFPVIYPPISPAGGLQPSNQVIDRKVQFGSARSVGGTCTLQGEASLQANALIQRRDFATNLTSGYLCMRQTVETLYYPPRAASDYRYVKVQRPITGVTDPDNTGVAVVEVRPNLPELTKADGAAVDGKVGEAYRLTATVSGSVVNNNLLERSVYSGYSPNNTSCAAATRNEQATANTQPIIEEGTFEVGRAGQFFCTFQSVNVSGTIHYSNVLYQEIVAADAPPAAGGPDVGAPPTTGPGDNAPPRFDRDPTPPGAGDVAPGETVAPRLYEGDVLELQAPATSAKAGDATVRLRTKASAKRGGKTRVTVTVQPTNSAGKVDFYLTTPKRSARVISVLGSADVTSAGSVAQLVTIPKMGTKKGKRYYLVAEYTSPAGDVAQVVRKIRLR